MVTIFSLLKTCQTIFQGSCDIFQSHPQCMIISVSQYPCQCLLFSILKIIPIPVNMSHKTLCGFNLASYIISFSYFSLTLQWSCSTVYNNIINVCEHNRSTESSLVNNLFVLCFPEKFHIGTFFFALIFTAYSLVLIFIIFIQS